MDRNIYPTLNFEPRPLRRRTLLKGALAVISGTAAAALLGCSGNDDQEEPAPTGTDGAVANLRTTDKRPAQLPAGWVWPEQYAFPTQFPEPAGKTPKAGGTLTVSASWDVGPLDPIKSSAGGSIVIPNIAYNRLIGFVNGPGADIDKLVLKPELAASWERTPDGLTYSFKMQPNVKWHNIAPLNGRAFVAGDVKYAFERYKADGLYKSYWTGVSSIDAPDASTLKITLSKPLVDFITPLGSRYQTIFPKELVDNGQIDKTSVGTGPAILKEATAATRVRFDKNPDYWQKQVLLDAVEFRVMPDVSARLAAFRAGQVEYGYQVVSTKADVDNLLKSNPDVQVQTLPPSSGTGAMPIVNMQNPKWQDVRVRRALTLAIDREAISKLIFEGLAATFSILPWAFVWDAQPTVESGRLGNWVRYAPQEAKQLLQAAGRENMTVEAPYFNYGASYQQRAEIMADQFRQVGITYNAPQLDYTTYNGQLLNGTFPDALHWGYLPLGFDVDTYFYNGIHSKSPGNRDHMADAEIDAWSEQQQVELNPAKRKDILVKIWNKYHDQAYRTAPNAAPGYDTMQGWLRGLRWGGFLGHTSSFYDWGTQIPNTWLDK